MVCVCYQHDVVCRYVISMMCMCYVMVQVEERCPEGERSRERSKVIYVNSKDNVNKCPQQ